MGHSPNIGDLRKEDKKFDTYIKMREQALNEQASVLQTRLDDRRRTFFKDIDDAQLMVSGISHHFQHEKEFSLDNLKNVIGAIGRSLFSVPDSISMVPKSVEVHADVGRDVVATSRTNLENTAISDTNTEAIIASKVFEILDGVLGNFDSSATASDQERLITEPAGFGVTLFCAVLAASYKSSGFTEKEQILEYVYVYQVYFSKTIAERGNEEKLAQQIGTSLNVFEAKVSTLNNDLSDNKITPQKYETEVMIWNNLISTNNKALSELGLTRL